jgi:hypothetical protein
MAMDARELEARLNAHREILIVLMSAMLADGGHDALLDGLEQDAVFRNGEEDPGIVPTGAFAPEAQSADEIRRLLDAAKARARAR